MTTVFLYFVYLTLSFPLSQATSIQIVNNCAYTVWAAANPGGGKKLNKGETWTLPNVTGSGRIWGRTNCAFGNNGRGKCESGDCGGRLKCSGINGRAPNTVAEYSINQGNRNQDAFFVSVVDGFNIPMEFTPAASSSEVCNPVMSRCAADVNWPCPMELRDPGGCNNPCTVFGNSQFCCNPGNICEPTSYSEFFKDLCPEAHTYPSDGSADYCPNGISYKLVFCPSSTAPDTNSDEAIFIFDIRNNCPYTVWAAAKPGGGQRLDNGESWNVIIRAKSEDAKKGGNRIWARTNCTFDQSGRGRCETGDCNGLLQCEGYGQPPTTLVEFAVNQFNNMDFFDISLVNGFNVPVEFSPTSKACAQKSIKCSSSNGSADGFIKEQCPHELRAPGGCNNPCTVKKTAEYCCNSGSSSCGPTELSKFFKDRCPDAYSYPLDDATSTFTCPSGTNYMVVFCP